MNLTKYEQETIINYNNEEKTASIFTYDKSLIRKLDKRLAEMSDMKLIRRGEDFAEYSFLRNGLRLCSQDNTLTNKGQKWQNA